MSEESQDTRKINFAGILHPNGAATLVWVWEGVIKSCTYPIEAMSLVLHNDDISWLTDQADRRS